MASPILRVLLIGAALGGMVARAAGGASHGVPAQPAVTGPSLPAVATPSVRARPVAATVKPPAWASGFVGAREMARILKLKTSWDERTRRLTLTGIGVRLVLELEQREAELNGVRVFLGAPTRWHNDELAVSRIDFHRLLTPLIRPGNGARPIPAVRTIVLDPGHGGRDTGKVHSKYRILEKEMTLDVARRLKALLEAQGYRVVLTRTDDRFLGLRERPDSSDEADLFISIHFNSVEAQVDQVTGVEVFTMTPQFQVSTGQSPDAQVAAFNPGNANDHWNAVLGYALHRTLLTSLQAPDRGLKRARYAVLRLARCPAALIEAGFLSNDAEARKIATPAYRQQIAAAIAIGVRHYVGALQGTRGQ